MREIRSSGSVEGVMSNRDPYSDSHEEVILAESGLDTGAGTPVECETPSGMPVDTPGGGFHNREEAKKP